MDDIDSIAGRVFTATGLGGILGASVATYRGLNIPRTAQSMALTWAMTATACLGTQRLALAAGRAYLPPKEIDTGLIMGSHAVGGILGGGVVGYLFIRKPIRGMIFLTPLMLMTGWMEIQFQEEKRVDLEERRKNQPQLTRTADGSIVTPEN